MAENERVISTVFKADISNFTASTQQLNRYVSQVNSEFRNATASMTKWNDNADGLRAKLEQLNKTHDAESRKLKALEEQYAEVVRTQGANSKAAQKLATDINNQSAKVKETKKNIDYYSDSLKELEDAGVSTKEELDKLNKEIAEQEKAAEKATDALEEQKNAAKELGGNIAKGAAAGIAGIGAACVGAMAGLNSLVEETKELRTQMALLETTFSQQGHSAATAEKTYNALFSVLGDSGKATEAAQHLAQMASSEKELEQLTHTLTGVYATFGDTLPIEGLAEAINHTSKLSGESAAVQGVLADALEWSGVNVDEFNAKLQALNTEEERAQLINSTLNGIYGETATKYKEVNADVIAANAAQNQYNQTMADLGEKAQPAITAFKTAMAEMLVSVFAEFEKADIEGIVSDISKVIVESVTWMLDHKDILIAGIAGIGAAFLTWKVATMIMGVVGAIKALTVATGAQTMAQTILNAVMSANPIGLIVTAVGLLIGAIVLLVLNFDKVKGAFKSMVNVCIGGINALIRGLNKLKIDIPDWVPEIGGGTLGFNIPTIPKLARGGIVDRPTLAIVGEAGKEVVMPLERNTQWLDKLADKISAKGNDGNKTINITNTFERMETSRHALHKANLEARRILKEV